jgi:mRNA interferase RelE/StbE
MRSARKLDPATRRRLADEVDQLARDPRAGKRLVGCRLTGKWSWRFGDYRVIYEVHDIDGVVELILVSHRRNVYGILQRFLSFLLNL